MDITQEQVEAIAQRILSEYQEAVDKKLVSFLNEKTFCHFACLNELSELYQKDYGRLLGIYQFLNSLEYYSQADYLWSLTDQLIDQFKLNNRVLSDIASARLHVKDVETTSPLALTLDKTELPELIAEGVIVPSLPEKACPPVPGDKPVQQATKEPSPFNGKPITDVEIRAVVPYEGRPSLVPVRGSFINVADCKSHTDWLMDDRGQVIPLKDKPCLVERVAKNGSFYACGRWFRRCIASVYINSDVFGTRLVYI